MAHDVFVPQDLLLQAGAETGIDPTLDDAILEGLAKYCDALNQPAAQLTAAGSVGMKKKILRFLKNNLRMQRDIANHPEILQESIRGPLVVSGTGRNGTSKLQKLLASSGDFNFIPLWMSLYPALLTGNRDESPQPRIAKTKEWIEWNCSLSPHFMEGHTFDAESADEELFILEQNFQMSRLYIYAPIPSYLAWIGGQRAYTGYDYLKKVLQYLQWQGLAQAGKLWLLKSPMHCGLEDVFLKVFPDAKFVMPHRNPSESSSSSYRMMQSFRDPYSAAQVVDEISLEQRAAHILQHMQVRNAHPEIAFLDLDYRELVADSASAVRKIYDFAGLSLTADAQRNMQDWELQNPKGKHGQHKHSLDDAGATHDDVRKAYAPYMEFLEQGRYI